MNSAHRGAVLEIRRVRLVSFSVRAQDGWGVGTVEASGVPPFAITGKVLDAQPGDDLEIRGTVVRHPRYGEQFKVESCVTMRPETVDGVVAWLEATMPNVGETRARALLSHFGSPAKLWAAIEHDHASLAAVSGITAATAELIRATYLASQGTREHMIVLRTWGLTTNQIQRCLNQWQTLDQVVAEVRNNPYSLARYVDGFGFKRADDVAQAQGMKHNDPRRIAAGIAHTLEQAIFEGHCFMWGGQLQRIAAEEVLGVSPNEAADGIRRAMRESTIVRRGARYYAAAMHVTEESATNDLGRLAKGPKAP